MRFAGPPRRSAMGIHRSRSMRQGPGEPASGNYRRRFPRVEAATAARMSFIKLLDVHAGEGMISSSLQAHDQRGPRAPAADVGSQRQRIAIAGALLKDGLIVILDEASSELGGQAGK